MVGVKGSSVAVISTLNEKKARFQSIEYHIKFVVTAKQCQPVFLKKKKSFFEN